jgi:hypothetical protein
VSGDPADAIDIETQINALIHDTVRFTNRAFFSRISNPNGLGERRRRVPVSED